MAELRQRYIESSQLSHETARIRPYSSGSHHCFEERAGQLLPDGSLDLPVYIPSDIRRPLKPFLAPALIRRNDQQLQCQDLLAPQVCHGFQKRLNRIEPPELAPGGYRVEIGTVLPILKREDVVGSPGPTN